MSFIDEAEIYRLAARAGLRPPRHARWGSPMPFDDGEPIVLKGLVRDLWHKSEAGALRMMPFDLAALSGAVADMQARVTTSDHAWIGALVCERVAIARSEGLPSEAFVSLSRRQGIWVLVVGLGGLHAETWGEQVPPLCWPIVSTTPAEAWSELSAHLLGQVWLGGLRAIAPLTSEARSMAFIEALWRLAAIAEEEGLDLVEMNPVALDERGEPRPLDGVGRRASLREPLPAPPPTFSDALLRPRRVAVAGVSARPGGVGRVIVDNLREAELAPGELVIVKPGARELMGLPCVPDVSALKARPVDLLLVALPAPAALETLAALIDQGGGARVVGMVSGGIGDGADHAERWRRLQRMLFDARSRGAWTPAVIGPNHLGQVVPARALDTTFIPADRWAPSPRAGPLALVSQSGAFLLTRLARVPPLPFGAMLALGGQLDVRLSHVLDGLVDEPTIGAVAAYVEGFAPGDLMATAAAAGHLSAARKRLLLYRAGRTPAGESAAASHTGALAGDLVVESAVLSRAGVCMTDDIATFDSALRWLAYAPDITAGPVAIVSNAGFETVSGADRAGGEWPLAELSRAEREALGALLRRHDLASLVSPRLPLDLTPMADIAAYRAVIDLLLGTEARVLIVGVVPFSRRLDPIELSTFAETLATLARVHGKSVGLVIDGGLDSLLRVSVALPCFTRLEDALKGLRVLSS